MSGLTDYKEFVADMSASSYFRDWKRKNPKEYTTWFVFDEQVQAGPATPPTLATKFGQGLVDAAVIYLNAYETDPTPVPPDPTPPDPTPVPPTPSGSPFQVAWDATQMPQKSWNAAKVISSQSALDSWLGNRQSNDHVICKGFTYNGRLEIRGGGAFWMECDPTFKVTNKKIGTVNFGFWLVSTNGACITGFPIAFAAGNQGLRAQAAQNCYLELDCQGNGGNGLLLDQIGGAGTKTGGTFKIKGGNNGLGCMPPGSPGYDPSFYSPDIDPHAQKGTGTHHCNTWMLEAGTKLLLDIDKEQKYGAGCESTGWAGTQANPITLAVRALNLSCDVNVIPPAPGGGRQAAGNLWQPWGADHSYVNVVSLEAASCARAVEALGSYSNCKVAYGRVAKARLSPCYPSISGISYGDVVPKP